MTKPARIQRRRIKGWRAPAGAKYVGRGTDFGNPFAVKQNVDRTGWHVYDARTHVWGPRIADRAQAHQQAVDLFRAMLRTPGGSEQAEYFARLLHGRDLMCWCAEDLPCHADVLLELANREATDAPAP